MDKLAGTVAVAVVGAVCLVSACSGPPPQLELRYGGSDDRSSFRLVNASDQEWSEVHVVVRGLRPDGIEDQCAEERFALWRPGDAQILPRCGDEKTLITVETGGQHGFFVLGGETLYRKLGRREIPIS